MVWSANKPIMLNTDGYCSLLHKNMPAHTAAIPNFLDRRTILLPLYTTAVDLNQAIKIKLHISRFN